MSLLGKHDREEAEHVANGQDSSEDEGPMPMPAANLKVAKKPRIVAHEKVYLAALPVCLLATLLCCL